jgi:hypothetical protein
MNNIIAVIESLQIEINQLQKLVGDDQRGFTDPSKVIELDKKRKQLAELEKQLKE